MITVDFIRHAQSLANIAEEKKSLKGYWELLTMVDPPLSTVGVQQCLNSKLKYYNPDLIIVSCLQRSIQTARLIWPSKKIVIAPHLRELGNYLQNKPLIQIYQNDVGNLHLFKIWLKKYLKKHVKIQKVVVITHSLLMKKDLNLSIKPTNLAIVRQVW